MFAYLICASAAVTETVFFAARYVLEYNRVLFPCHKSQLLICLKRRSSRRILNRVAKLDGGKDPGVHGGVCQAFEAFAPVKLDFLTCITQFMEDSEKTGRTVLHR